MEILEGFESLAESRENRSAKASFFFECRGDTDVRLDSSGVRVEHFSYPTRTRTRTR